MVASSGYALTSHAAICCGDHSARSLAATTARNRGWAYRIDEFKANQITATRETLLKPPGT